MQFGPSFDQSFLPFWQRTGDQFDGIDAENADLFLIVSVEVRDVVLRANLHEHSDDDAEEAAQFSHSLNLSKFDWIEAEINRPNSG